MKKNWIEPEVQALDVQNTFGGPKFNPEQDAEIWFCKETNMWWTPYGES